MKILFAGFKDLDNTSKLLLDKINNKNKVYLENDKQKSCSQIENVLMQQSFDYIILMGQKPVIKDKINIELEAHNGEEKLITNFDVNYLTNKLNNANITYSLSKNPGTSFCNNIYFFTLNFLSQNKREEKCIFLHLPQHKNINNLNMLVSFFNEL